MTASLPIDGHRIGAGQPSFIIAEAASNHDGKLNQALELIDVAAESGADAVKFQLFNAASLYPTNCGVVDTPDGKHDFYELLRLNELPPEWLPTLRVRARERGIVLLCTPFDADAIDTLVHLDVPAIKIASPELTHLPLLRHAGQTHRPILLSTGMSDFGEVEESVGVLRDAGAVDIALFHCVTAYPAPFEDCNLDVIPALQHVFDVPVGLSDHTIDAIAAPLVATSLGGSLIEKHFTLSRDLHGPDHAFAIEPGELSAMVAAIRELEQLPSHQRLPAAVDRLGDSTVQCLRGSAYKRATRSEADLAWCDRRALHAVADIQPGERLSDVNVAVLRGERNLGGGLHPRFWDVLQGARTLTSIRYGEGIRWEHVIDRQ